MRIQVAVALIAYLLLRLAQATQSAVKSPLDFARLVRTNLMHRKRIDRLIAHNIPPPNATGKPPFNGLKSKPDSSGASPGMTEGSERGGGRRIRHGFLSTTAGISG